MAPDDPPKVHLLPIFPEVRRVPGVPPPLGEDAPKMANTSLGGECARSVSRKTPKKCFNPPTSDELINYTDTVLKEVPEETSARPEGMASPALYDCHPTSKTLNLSTYPDKDKAIPPFHGHL